MRLVSVLQESLEPALGCCPVSESSATSLDPLPQPQRHALTNACHLTELMLLEKSAVQAGLNVVLLAYQMMTLEILRTLCYLRHQGRDPATLR